MHFILQNIISEIKGAPKTFKEQNLKKDIKEELYTYILNKFY